MILVSLHCILSEGDLLSHKLNSIMNTVDRLGIDTQTATFIWWHNYLSTAITVLRAKLREQITSKDKYISITFKLNGVYCV